MDINQLGLVLMGTVLGWFLLFAVRRYKVQWGAFAASKRPEAGLRRRDVVPKAFGGVRTDIVETGRFHALETAQAVDVGRTKRIRPAPGGVSIGHVQITAGTLGVLARRNGRPVILSNNHVLANQNAGRVGDPIRQPGPGR